MFLIHRLDGSGTIVGLLQFDGYTASDITYYESQAGLPAIQIAKCDVGWI